MRALAGRPFAVASSWLALLACSRHADDLTAGRGTFVPKVDGGRVVAIATGDAHSCALLRDGSVQCWGFNWLGEASGTRELGTTVRAPRAVEGVSGAVQIASGGNHTCVRDGAGMISCWGANLSGALDGHPTLNTNLGVRSAHVRGDDLEAGYGATCALSGGKATCWGEADYGRLVTPWTRDGAIGSTGLRNLQAPLPAAGLNNVRQITLGLNHGCALLEGGTVSCWGLDNAGQLGHPGVTLRPDRSAAPTPVVGLEGVVQIDAYGFATCALRVDGSVWCWGRNDQGLLGVGGDLPRIGIGRDPHSASPVRVEGLADAIQVAVGGDHACAVTRARKAMCWGQNDVGQLGDGTTESRRGATLVTGLDDVAQIAPGTASKKGHTCALRRNGEVLCWGNDREGALGVGHSSTTPARVAM